MEVEQHKYYLGRINYLSDDLKSEALPNGLYAKFHAIWQLQEGERFAGDFAMYPAEAPHWIPSREVIILKEITREEYKAAGLFA